jgi:uncharacterized protein (TIGR02466 family)
MSYHVVELFPTVVLAHELGREFTAFEKTIFDTISKNQTANEGNKTSQDNYVLKRKGLSKLYAELNESVEHYLKEIYNARGDVSLYITQSWINYTKQGEYHHKHSHPNSILSGIIYLDVDEDSDRIYFYKRSDETNIKIPQVDWNRYNCDSWWLPAKTGMIYIFPSTLTHMVESKKGLNLRVSLSFNTFVKGNLGSNNRLTELIL